MINKKMWRQSRKIKKTTFLISIVFVVLFIGTAVNPAFAVPQSFEAERTSIPISEPSISSDSTSVSSSESTVISRTSIPIDTNVISKPGRGGR